MFYKVSNVSTLDVSNFNTSNVVDTSGMFRYCSNLSSIGDITNWDMSKVTNTSLMFEGCAFKELNLPSTLTTIGEGFAYECKKLTKVVMGDNVKTLGLNSFRYDSAISEFHLSANITKISAYSFWDVNNSKYVWRGNTYSNKYDLKTALANAGITDVVIE